MEVHPATDSFPNTGDGLKNRRFISLIRRIACLLFDLMKANGTQSIRLAAMSTMLRRQQIFDDGYDDNGWLTTERTNANRRRKQTGKLVTRMVGIISTFLDAYFELIYLSDVNDFVIQLRDSSPSHNESQLFNKNPMDTWTDCQAIVFLNRLDRMFYKSVEDELSHAMGGSEEVIQCPFELSDDDGR
ncbi:hypothetical protein GPALN_011467 [Globodera pallida]|nr:hypothetical protein GPALN_011467 [Globodera pallida]